jgi:hypothetical protein
MQRFEAGQFGDVTVEGGPGDSIERAIVIKGCCEKTLAAPIEQAILGQEFGEQNKDWQLQMRSLEKHRGRTYDVLDLVLNDRRRTTYYFDVTEFIYKDEPSQPPESSPFFAKFWAWVKRR